MASCPLCGQLIAHDEVRISASLGVVMRGDHWVELTPQEAWLLDGLFKSKQSFVPSNEMAAMIYHHDIRPQSVYNVIMGLVLRLRKKLKPLDIHIFNKQNWGYYLVVQERSSPTAHRP